MTMLDLRRKETSPGPRLFPASGDRRRGFTLIEVLTVTVIVGILAVAAIPLPTMPFSGKRKSSCGGPCAPCARP